MTDDLGSALVAELRLFLTPLADALLDEIAQLRFFADLGLDLRGLTSDPQAHLTAVGDAVAGALAVLDQVPLPPQSLDDLQLVLTATAAIPAAIEALGGLADAFPATIDPPLDVGRLATDTLTVLALRYLDARTPLARPLLELLGVIRPRTAAELVTYTRDPGTGRVIRFAPDTPVLDLGRIGALLTDPVAAVRESYLNGGPAAAVPLADALFPRLAALAAELGGSARVADRTLVDTGGLGEFGTAVARSTIVLQWRTGPDDTPAEATFGAVLGLSPADAGGLGLVITPIGQLTLTVPAGDWSVESTVAAGGGTVAVGLTRIVLTGDDAYLDGSVTVTSGGESGPAVRLGGVDGTRLEIGTLSVTGTLQLADGLPPDIGVLVRFGAARVAIAAGDGDGFLAKILPPGGIVCDFELGVGYSTRRGLYLEGAAQLTAHIPVHESFLGILDLQTIDLAIGAAGSGVTVAAAATVGANLGPVKASVEQIGVRFTVDFPDGGGNVGPAQLGVGFQPPTGAGLVIEAGPVTGGGYVLADHANGRYGGILQLEIAETVAVTAIGLVSTRLPDGRRGFSLLVLIAAEFPPIQLGFGFTLVGLGGVLGANRGMAVDALRAGIRTRALDSVLFPRDPVANASRVIRDVDAMFPAAEGQFLVGLMVAIGWGSPTLVRVELGIIIELPSPVRVALLGRLTMELPAADAAVVEIHVDILGILDFGARELSVDATMYDSRVGAFTLTGDFASRLNYGPAPAFALSAGGFHPRFTPPPGFPALNRVSIALATSDNPRFRVEAYLATTPTSVQVGARLEVYAEADFGGVIGRWSVDAFVGFDALVHLRPQFRFVVDLAGGATLRRNRKVILGVALNLTLSGPQPWHAVGSAQFKVLFFKPRIRFSVTIGAEPPDPAVPFADPVADLVAALGDAASWTAQLPATGPGIVAVREVPGDAAGVDTVLVHPLGALDVVQRVVPLEVRFDRYGGGPVAEESRTLAVAVTIAGRPVDGDAVREPFSAGQFFDLPDDAQLTGEAFPRLVCGRAGLRLPAGPVTAPATVDGEDGYETAVVNPANRRRVRGPAGYRIAPATLDALVFSGAAARAATLTTGTAAYRGEPLGIAVAEPAYRLVTVEDLRPVPGDQRYPSTYEAAAARPAGTAYQVVGAHEGGTP